MLTLSFCWVPLTAAALLAPVTPLTVVSSRHLAESLQSLDHALETLQPGVSAAGGDPALLVNACLAVCRALPGAQGVAAIPEDAAMLREAAAFFDWENADGLGQHLFDASLWDDALEALASAVSRADCELAVEAAAAVAASARFVLLAPEARRDALDALADAVASDDFIAARRRALAAAKLRRGTPRSEADALAFALERRRAQDYVAVAPSDRDDIEIIRALYACATHELGPCVLRPLGFPPTKLGLRSLVAADRAAGSQRAAAALGRAWHAANALAPIIAPLPPAYSGGDGGGDAAGSLQSGDCTRDDSADAAASGAADSRTLVLVFSSLGWNGVVRAEWGATLREVGDESIAVAHALDTAQSWWPAASSRPPRTRAVAMRRWLVDPQTGEYDDGAWWDDHLARLCAPYQRVCILGESMGATGALRFARLATVAVVALVPQIDLRDFEYAGRADFTDECKARLVEEIQAACRESGARIVLHVGRDPPDLKQLSYLPAEAEESGRLRVVRHDVPGHTLGAGLKAAGLLRKTVLGDLLGHSYRLPAAGETCA